MRCEIATAHRADTGDTEHQRNWNREDYQQSSKDATRIASARLEQAKRQDRDSGYG